MMPMIFLHTSLIFLSGSLRHHKSPHLLSASGTGINPYLYFLIYIYVYSTYNISDVNNIDYPRQSQIFNVTAHQSLPSICNL